MAQIKENGWIAIIERVDAGSSFVYRATVNGKTICSCKTMLATIQNARFLMRGHQPTFRALIT